MPKISLNELIKSNNAPVALNFIFADYADAKKAQQRAKQSGKLRIIKEGGKELPTPNELVGQLAKRQVEGAYTLSSSHNGAVQKLTFADEEEAKKFIAAFKGQLSKGSTPKPFKAIFSMEVKLDAQIRMAKSFGLM
jgi:membrane peptidoglycan carboxypeptidase